MGQIREELRLVDSFSQTFNRFNAAAASSTNTAEGFQSTLDDVTANFASFSAAVQNATAALEQLPGSIDNIADEQSRVTAETNKTAAASNNWLGTIKSIAASIGAMKLAQEFIETSDAMSQMTAKLNMINDGMWTTDELQKMIMASAQRSRSSYADTADLVTRLRQNAKGIFTNNAEATLFAENLNKAFKISGASAQEQASVILQLSQAMAGGVLRGQEFNAIMSGSHNIIDMIAEEMGVPSTEMKKMAEEGKITADIVKAAMLNATDGINEDFKNLPMTWGDMIQQGKNTIQFALQEAFGDFSKFINTDEWQAVMNTVTNAIIVAARVGSQALMAIGRAIVWVQQNWAKLAPIVYGAVAAFIAFKVASAAASIGSIKAALASAAAWLAANWPILLVAAALGTVVYICKRVGVTFEQVGAFIGAVVGGVYGIIYNYIAGLYNYLAGFVEFFVNVWDDPIGSVVRLFVNFADSVLAVIQSIAEALDWVFGSHLSDAVQNWRNDMQEWTRAKVGDAKYTIDRMEYKNVGDTMQAFSDKGADMAGNLKDMVSSLTGSFNTVQDINSGLGDLNSLMNDAFGPNGEIPRVGTVGEIEKNVNLGDEDLRVFRDLAEMKYLQNIELKTLAPNINVTVPASENGEALSPEDVANAIKVVLVDQMSAHTSTAH